jgi:DNA sulfur modification protein DndD
LLLTKVIINDFGVYRGRNEFDFQTKPDKPIILCGGTNGAGKTTLFESIMLCFYGQNSFEQKTSQKQYHDRILRKIHRYLGTKKAADEASVTIEFQFAHEEKIVEYPVMRMWQNNDGKIDERFTIKKKKPSDEKFVKLDSIEESGWQVFIEQLIPKGIVKLFFFDGEQIQKIADEGEIDNHIKSSFDALLGLDLVKQLINDIGLTLLRNSKGETKKILDEINRLTKEKEESEEKRDGFQNKQVHLQTKIDLLQKQVDVQEVNFKKIGGQFARNREELTIEKTRLESKLEDVEKEIRELCSDTLPFSLIPKQMEEVKNEIMADQQKLQDSFQKSILEKNARDLMQQIQKGAFSWESLSERESTDTFSFFWEIIREIDKLLHDKIESVSNPTKPTYNLSAEDMNQTRLLIYDINNSSEQKIESLVNTFNIVSNSLEQIKVGLDSAPREDEFGPIFSELTQTTRELGELQNELEHLRTLESQEKSLIILVNSKIRANLKNKHEDKKRMAGLEIGSNVQDVLEDYAKSLHSKKLELLESYILDKLQVLLHKQNFIEKISIDRETFQVKLYKGNDDEITKDMLSKGELQMYATAVVWGLALTSGRPLPFMIDTPLARLDEEHRNSVVEQFYPSASHQTIILSTDSEVNFEYYKKLEPYISNSFVIQYDSDKGSTRKHDTYFFDKKGERIIEV